MRAARYVAITNARRSPVDGQQPFRARLAELSRVRWVRLAVAVLFAAALAPAQTIVREPYLQSARFDRVAVLWTMLQSGQAQVQFSTDGSYSRAVFARIRDFSPSETGLVFPYYQYLAELTNLQADREYFYRLVFNGSVILQHNELRFKTPPAGSGPFTFQALGDSGTNSTVQTTIAARMNGEPSDLVLHLGDIAYPSGTYQEFQANHFDVYRRQMRKVPFFPVAGNHEYWFQGSAAHDLTNAIPFINIHFVPSDGVPLPDHGRYYSFDWSNAHFIAIDSNLPLRDAANGVGPMLQWLENDLQRTQRFWKIAYFHHPPYAGGPNQNDPFSILAREKIVPILERYGVQLVLNGHEHSYQRTASLRDGSPVPAGTGTVYVTSGGGGSTRLYEVFNIPGVTLFGASVNHYLRGRVDGSRLTIEGVRVDGAVIDSVTIAPPPSISEDGVVNAASFGSVVAPGSLISIFGRNLAVNEGAASRLPLPTELGAVNVTVNGRRIPILYAAANQINAQLPFDASGNVVLRVTTPNGASETSLRIFDAAPGIFVASTEQGRVATVVRSDGSLVSSASPIRAGEIVTVYLTGLGACSPDVVAGQAAPSSPLATTRLPVTVRVAGVSITPLYAGLTPGYAGLYQVNFRVPADTQPGLHALEVVAGNVSSNIVTLSVR